MADFSVVYNFIIIGWWILILMPTPIHEEDIPLTFLLQFISSINQSNE